MRDTITEEDLLIMQLKMNRAPNINTISEYEPDDTPESVLQSKIRAHSKKMGWPEPLIFRQTKAVQKLIPPGWPDCVIPIPYHILIVETKARKKELRKKQELTRLNFGRIGLIIHKINSFRAYLALVDRTIKGD